MYSHTVTLSDDGVVYSFGQNEHGQLGLGQEMYVPLPTPISDIPQIKQIACGWGFTFFVDYEGLLWSCGKNNFTKLDVVTKETNHFPKQIQNIPLVRSVACGLFHILIITNIDFQLWSCGHNSFGQLCLENNENQPNFQQTSFSNISHVSLGCYQSLFQNYEGEIYSCGSNRDGELALGHNVSPQLKPTLIPNLPSNIIQFICGNYHNLFLDSDGNVYSVGFNNHGQLGLGHYNNQNVLTQIPNIPPIKVVSCSANSSYLIDFDGNLWSFGLNSQGQLGHGNVTNTNIPIKIESLRDIKQCCRGHGNYFLVKDIQDRVFAFGDNVFGQLGTGNRKSLVFPYKINSTIWGEYRSNCRAKSARK